MLVRMVVLVGTLMVMTMCVVVAMRVGHAEDARKTLEAERKIRRREGQVNWKLEVNMVHNRREGTKYLCYIALWRTTRSRIVVGRFDMSLNQTCMHVVLAHSKTRLVS